MSLFCWLDCEVVFRAEPRRSPVVHDVFRGGLWKRLVSANWTRTAMSRFGDGTRTFFSSWPDRQETTVRVPRIWSRGLDVSVGPGPDVHSTVPHDSIATHGNSSSPCTTRRSPVLVGTIHLHVGCKSSDGLQPKGRTPRSSAVRLPREASCCRPQHHLGPSQGTAAPIEGKGTPPREPRRRPPAKLVRDDIEGSWRALMFAIHIARKLSRL